MNKKINNNKNIFSNLSEDDYGALLAAVSRVALVSVTDNKGDIIYINDKFVEVSKYSREELIGQNHRILKSGQQKDEMFVDLWKTISSGEVWQGEIKNKAKDGSYYWVDTSIAAILNPDGKPERYIAVRFLITDKKEKEESYFALLTALDKNALVSETNIKGDITYVNDKFVEVSKYSREELIGQNHRILKSGQQKDEMFVDLWKTISSGEVWRGEIKNKAKDGSYYWVDTSISPILNSAGKPERYIAVRFLITDKKEKEESVIKQNLQLDDTKKAMLNVLEDIQEEKVKAEKLAQKLAETQAKDEAMLYSIGEGVFATDKDGKMIFANRAFFDMTGYSEKETLNNNFTHTIKIIDRSGKVIEGEDRPAVKTLKTGRVNNFIGDYEKKDGSVLPVSVTSSPIILDGQTIGVVEVFRDITKEMEIDKAKTEFVSLASHQLRTPLTAINWYAEMLINNDAGEITPEQKKYVEEIYRGNQRMVDLVNALLSVSRLELGTFAVDPSMVDIVELCKDVVLEMEPKIFERKTGLTEKYDKDFPKVNVDRNLMRIILQNLISNAIKYTQEEGNVNVTIEKENRDGEDKMHIQVSDNGYGIPKASQDKIFSKLYRADNIRTMNTDGTGLGLYIIKSILEKTGGSVSFVSEEKKGTTFDVYLPMSGMKSKEGTKTLEA